MKVRLLRRNAKRIEDRARYIARFIFATRNVMPDGNWLRTHGTLFRGDLECFLGFDRRAARIVARAAERRARRLIRMVDRDPTRLLRPDLYDLMPADLKARLREVFHRHFPDVAAAALVDETGERFYPVDALAGTLGLSTDEILNELATEPARPVGALHRLH